MKTLQNVSDSQLLHLCVQFGSRALKWRRKFTGLLPEVARRKLYEKKGFHSIFEFAYKLAGLSEKQVRRCLNLETRFEKLPHLKNLLTNGEASLNKLARVASIANEVTDEELAEKVMTLPQGALETLVRDVKVTNNSRDFNSNEIRKTDKANSLNMPLFEGENVRTHTLNFELSQEVIEKLNHLNFQGHDVNKIILELLEKRRAEIEERKEKLGQEAIERRETKKTALAPGEKIAPSRYISVKIRKVLKEEYGTKCSIPHCPKPATGDHHSQRLALVKIHDPRYIAPMCKEHHAIAHSIDKKYIQKRKMH